MLCRVMKANSMSVVVTGIRWLGRLLALGVFLLWGAFFVEHAQEWVIAPSPNLPPLEVCVGQALHLLLLVGLLVSLRWPRIGSVWVIVAAFAFFHGKTGSRFPVFFGLTILPVLLLLLCGWLDRRNRDNVADLPATC